MADTGASAEHQFLNVAEKSMTRKRTGGEDGRHDGIERQRDFVSEPFNENITTIVTGREQE